MSETAFGLIRFLYFLYVFTVCFQDHAVKTKYKLAREVLSINIIRSILSLADFLPDLSVIDFISLLFISIDETRTITSSEYIRQENNMN